MNGIYFRHPKIRMQQKELMEEVYSAIISGENMIAHAPTGLGKSDAVLGAAITAAMENDLSIFFLTPKISQHRIAVDVINGIAKKHKIDIRAVDLVGRKHACIDPALSELDADGFYHSCEKKRKHEICPFYGKARGYGKRAEEASELRFKKMLDGYGIARTHEEIKKLGEASECCPYEWMVKLAASSRVIIGDYYHIMVPAIRDILLLKSKKKLEKSIVIIDEAHNLGKRVREQLSSTASTYLFKRIENEMKMLKADDMKLEAPFAKWAAERLDGKKEKIVSALGFSNFVSEYGIEKNEFAVFLEDLGLEFIERTGRKSACLKFSMFLNSWGSEDEGCVRILRESNGNFFISKRFLDASIATSVLNTTHSSIFMSGTLIPLEMHRDVLGLDPKRTKMKRFSSPFDEERIMNVISLGHTTRYTERKFENYRAMAGTIDKIIDVTPGGTALFFPSYNVQNAVLPLIKSRNLLIQKENMTPLETMELLRRFGNGGILCGVQGGSLSEGIDYCNGEIKTVIVIGIALEEMNIETEALIEYYEGKFGRGWDYGYLYPAIIKALQAAGRGIRKESDRCAVVYLDERFRWKNYWSVLNNGQQFIVTEEPEKYVNAFWKD